MHSHIKKLFRILQYMVVLGLALGFLSGPASAKGKCKGKGLTNVTLKSPKAKIKGVKTDYGYKFLGIPYAAPPVRWQPPQSHPGWEGRLNADEFGPHCAQNDSPFGGYSNAEDCLYLNVYRPRPFDQEEDDVKAPVMVYIHGGSLIYGRSHGVEPVKLVEQGIVVVTINYRLGPFGYLAHPALSAESSDGISGNYGFMDQRAALQWVQDNIKRFGGDPDNVTIFGNSAGAHSIMAHMSSPGSAGLFHRVILQSGTYTLEQPTLQQWEYAGMGVIAAAGCPMQDIECMRALPVESLLAVPTPISSGYLTVVDGVNIPMQIGAALATGQFNQVPVMEGTNRDEFMLFIPLYFDFNGNPVTPETYIYAVIGVLGLDPTDPVQMGLANYITTAVYPLVAYDTPSQAVGAVGTDVVFSCNSLAVMNWVSQYVPTYTYEFNDPNAPQIFLPPLGYSYGAYHTSEIQYIMDTQRSFPYAPEFTEEQEALSDTIVSYWAQFAYDGDPNVAGAPEWEPFSPSFGLINIQSLEPENTHPFSVMDFATSHKCAFWASL